MTATSFGGLEIRPEALEKLSEDDRAAVREQLGQLEGAVGENPLLAYRPHARQREFHVGPWPRSRLFIGGNRSGKTTATLVDTILQCVDSQMVPEHLKPYRRWEPPIFVRVVGPDLTRWLELVALQKFREWCPRSQLQGGGFQRGWDKQQMVLRFKNGSMVQFMSNDQDLEKFEGAALHRVVYDESPRQDIRRGCLMRLIDFGGEELFGLTPLDGMSNWVYDDFYAPWERGGHDPKAGGLDPRFSRLVLVDMDDNPHLSGEDKEWSLQGLSEEEREARKTGRFVAFSGLIYPRFSRLRHVVPELPLPQEGKSAVPSGCEVFAGIDPGIRHMCAVVFCFLSPENDLVVFDEIALQGRTIREVCTEIEKRKGLWGVRPRWFVIDPASRNKSGQTGRSDQQEFLDNGVVTIPGQNAVVAGINRVKERLDADKLHVTANCGELIAEFKRYRWVRDASRTEDDARERPVKKDDHLLDALRYVCAQRPLAPEGERPVSSDSFKDKLLRHSLNRLRREGSAGAADSGFGPGIFA